MSRISSDESGTIEKSLFALTLLHTVFFLILTPIVLIPLESNDGSWIHKPCLLMYTTIVYVLVILSSAKKQQRPPQYVGVGAVQVRP